MYDVKACLLGTDLHGEKTDWTGERRTSSTEIGKGSRREEAEEEGVMIDLGKYPRCRDCVNYDTSLYPDADGRMAICWENRSGMYFVRHYSLGCEFFKERKSPSGGSV